MMLFFTHLLFAILIGLIFSKYFSYEFLFVLLTGFFGIFLDIDKVNSKIGKKVKFISIPLNLILGHRKLIHSLLFVLFGYVILNVFSSLVAYAFLLGTLSHLFLDSLTKEGIMPFYPLKWKIKGFLKTGSLIEKVLFVLMLGLAILASTNYSVDFVHFNIDLF